MLITESNIFVLMLKFIAFPLITHIKIKFDANTKNAYILILFKIFERKMKRNSFLDLTINFT